MQHCLPIVTCLPIEEGKDSTLLTSTLAFLRAYYHCDIREEDIQVYLPSCREGHMHLLILTRFKDVSMSEIEYLSEKHKKELMGVYARYRSPPGGDFLTAWRELFGESPPATLFRQLLYPSSPPVEALKNRYYNSRNSCYIDSAIMILLGGEDTFFPKAFSTSPHASLLTTIRTFLTRNECMSSSQPLRSYFSGKSLKKILYSEGMEDIQEWLLAFFEENHLAPFIHVHERIWDEKKGLLQEKKSHAHMVNIFPRESVQASLHALSDIPPGQTHTSTLEILSAPFLILSVVRGKDPASVYPDAQITIGGKHFSLYAVIDRENANHFVAYYNAHGKWWYYNDRNVFALPHMNYEEMCASVHDTCLLLFYTPKATE